MTVRVEKHRTPALGSRLVRDYCVSCGQRAVFDRIVKVFARRRAFRRPLCVECLVRELSNEFGPKGVRS